MLRLLSKTGVISLFLVGNVIAQDAHLSLYNQLPMVANPAMTGLFPGKLRASVLYRDQWKQVAPYKTALLAVEMNIADGVFGESDYLAVGLVGYQDVAGVMKYGTTEIRAQAAYHKYLDSEPSSQSDIVNFSRRKRMSLIAAGFSVGLLRRGISKPEEIKAPNQWDGSKYNSSIPLGENLSTATLFDVGTGALFVTRLDNGLTFTISTSIYHILVPNTSLIGAKDNLYRRIGIYGNIRSPIGDKLAIKTGGLYWMQGPYSLINTFLLGEYAINRDRDKLTIIEGGIVGDLTLGFGPYLGFEYKFIKIGFLYQIVFGEIKNIGQHTPEMLLQYINRNTTSDAPRL